MENGYPALLDWTQAAAAGVVEAGGKGWNLGRLHRYGFRVPRGGVVAAHVYGALLSDPEITGLMAEVEHLTPERLAQPEATAKLHQIRERILSADFPHGFSDQVHVFLAEHELEHAFVAVRSSATAEDSEAASFAGIHESTLNVRGPGEILQAIKACYASLWTPRALVYRRAVGISDAQVRCAVVICEMVGEAGPEGVTPVSAGVAFSCDPRTGDRDRVTISAVAGLGDTLVSGATNPEELTVCIATESEYHVIDRRSPGEPVLSDEAAIKLTREVMRVMWALGDGQDPQDVEWVYDGSRFWLVQARPVTRLPRRVPEGAEALPAVWSNANLKDAVPVVLSTYGWSMMRQIINHNLYAPHRASGYPVPSGIEPIRRFSGRPYFDLTTMAWIYYDAFGIPPEELNRSLGGHQPIIDIPRDGLFSRKSQRRNRVRFKLLRVVREYDRRTPQAIDDVFQQLRQWMRQDLTALSDQRLLKELEGVMRAGVAFSPRSMLANTSAGLWQQLLEVLLERVAPGRGMSLTAALMAGGGGVVSAEHGFRLYDLARTARNDPDALMELQRTPVNPFGWQKLPKTSPFRQEFEAFLTEFGHRGVYEVDVANPRWNEDPTYLLDQIRMILERGSDASDPRAIAHRRRLEAEQEVASRTRFLRGLIRRLAERARRGYRLREGSKSALVAFLAPTRRLLLEVGRRMVEAGNLERIDDVFFLSTVDVELLLRGLWDGTGARNLVADRRRQWEAWLKDVPPDVFTVGDDGTLHPWKGGTVSVRESSEKRDLHTVSGRGARLVGIAVSPGKVQGRARVLKHPNEGHRLAPGEILVAPSTDPGWTPLFLRAAAVVMEVGGYHSHGAIVSREYGLPAVVNIPGLLEQVHDGDEVLVDGDAGTVIV